MIATGIKEYKKVGFHTLDSQIIDVSKVEVWNSFGKSINFALKMVTGKMMEQGPALVITFQVFMLHVVKNSEGKVIEGDPVKTNFKLIY
jgi:hypothetical protein